MVHGCIVVLEILTLKSFSHEPCAKLDEELKWIKDSIYGRLGGIRMLFRVRWSQTRGQCFKDSKEVMEEIREESRPRERVYVV